MHRLLLLIILQKLLNCISAGGSTAFQCPNGYYLSRFASAHDGTERFYSFSCSKFTGPYSVLDEECNVSDVATSENGDIYLSCGSDKYTAGLEIVEGSAKNVTSWQILCCGSESVKIRTEDCIETKFLNDIKRASSFSSGTQVVRKWHAMPENDDLRWWLQLCPVDLVAKKFGLLAIDPVRARRQIPNEWSRGRFPPIELNPVFMQQEQLDDHRRLRLFESTNQINAFPSGSFWPPMIPSAPARFGNLFGQSMDPLSMLSLTVMPPVSLSATVLPLTTAPSTTTVEESDLEGSQESFVTGKPTSLSSNEITTGEREDKALDYYDAIDENFDKAKYEGKGGFLSGVSDLLQNLQDGLTLAQVALPSNKKLVFPTSSTTEGPSFLLSRDDNSLTIGVKNDNDMQKLDSLVKLQGFGPNPARPDGSSNMQTLKTNLGDPGAIQQMLQFFGLCKQEL